MAVMTPRRILMSPAGSARKRSAPATTPARRRQGVLRRKLRGSMRKVSIARIVNAVEQSAQEKKRIEIPLSIGSKRVFTSYLIGSDILAGPQSSQRIGNHITLTGVNVKGFFQNTNGVAPAATGCPLILRMYLVTTTRSDNPSSYWYQGLNADSNIGYGPAPFFTNDTIGDRNRMLYRLNLQDMTLLVAKTYKVYPRLTDGVNNKTTIAFKWFKKLNVKMHYNNPSSATPPLAADQVRPNIWLCYFLENPDVGSTDVNVFGTAQFTCTQYYRE